MSTSVSPAATTPTPDIERQARRRVASKMGFYRHALIYFLVNTGLLLLAWQQGKMWAAYPAMGWGLGLAIHGISVFWLRGGDLQQRMIAQERNRLMQTKQS